MNNKEHSISKNIATLFSAKKDGFPGQAKLSIKGKYVHSNEDNKLLLETLLESKDVEDIVEEANTVIERQKIPTTLISKLKGVIVQQNEDGRELFAIT